MPASNRNTGRIARQWLETDAALGAQEVPIPRKRKAAKAAPVPAASAARPAPASFAARRVDAVAPRPAAIPAAPVAAAARPAPARAPVAAARGPVTLPPPPAGNIADLPPITRQQKTDLLEKLRQKCGADCQAYINNISTRLVFGEGDPDAVIMFVGEGPGIEEDRTGRPFVGRSGQLLDKMIVAMGYKRDPEGGPCGIYIANVVKLRCADPDETNGGRLKDRPPTPEEAARGLPILHQQIQIIRPKVIVTLGAPAVRYVTGTTEGVMKIRGTWLSYRGIPVMPTYHPSFLLRAYTEENRRKVWSDLQLAMKKAKE